MDADAIIDLFAGFGPVRVRRMFGGAGIYADGLMFAVEAGGALYLKADEAFAAGLASRGSVPFTYETRDGRRRVMSFWRVPDAALDDGEDLAALSRRALEVARRAGDAKAQSRRAQRKPARASGRGS